MHIHHAYVCSQNKDKRHRSNRDTMHAPGLCAKDVPRSFFEHLKGVVVAWMLLLQNVQCLRIVQADESLVFRACNEVLLCEEAHHPNLLGVLNENEPIPPQLLWAEKERTVG